MDAAHDAAGSQSHHQIPSPSHHSADGAVLWFATALLADAEPVKIRFRGAIRLIVLT
jgi:hypothetical protein